ncbi:unnamed protein product [Dicrocoelium dendriticum]|nr:unnamed protein product [Dicrocoelium dendriticum]
MQVVCLSRSVVEPTCDYVRNLTAASDTGVGGRRQRTNHLSAFCLDPVASAVNETTSNFRWIVPARGEIRLRLRFQADRVGQFDQVFHFEVLGTRRVYELYCRGICAVPSISREPRLIYQNRKRSIKPNEIVHKTYIKDTGIFEFGPLLIEKTREKVLADCYPENKTIFNLTNTTAMDADMSLGLLYDSNEDTFGLSPKTLYLPSGQSKPVTIWAHPRTAKRQMDALVCCVRNNPEPIVMQIACDGVLPEVVLDKRVFNFEKVLLQRKEVRSIALRNPTLLPLLWRLSGVETLGEEFSVPQDAGVVEPKSEFVLYLYFRAMKPYKTGPKRSLRLEVYDIENLAGVIQVETIQVIAEAYDVALDISFPKACDGVLDFGRVKVGEEVKQPLVLKNRGPYEIAVNFVLKTPKGSKVRPDTVFTITPQRMNLPPSEKPTSVMVS